MRAPVNRIVPFSSVDGPGNRTAVFLQGCNFNCRYCHNPETIRVCTHCGACVSVCPVGALRIEDGEVRYDWAKCKMCDACIHVCPHSSCPRIRNLSDEECMHEIEKQIPFIRGVTVSGGECTLHRDFLVALSRRVRAHGLGFLLDSNGNYDFSADGELLNAVDGVMLDVKAWDAENHLRLTGADNALVKRNLDFLATAGKLEEVRTVVAPDWMNPEETVEAVSRRLVSLGAANTRYKIIRYRPMGVRSEYRDQSVPAKERLNALAERANALGIANTVLI
ncbi:MAG: YjjW family glycine radical enzyme activase [Clostridia bacterium]|nr:YjjW family glycine radical enzyme activase [Clostridia bacterium]